MSDDLSETLLSGDEYERAVALTRRVFPISLPGKIRVCVATLLSAGLLLPAISYRIALIGALEGVPTDSTPMPAFLLVAATGVVSTFLIGLLLVAQRRTIETRELDFETAQRMVRIEDLLMTVVVSTGVLFVIVPVALALLGVVAPGIIGSLYERDIEVYRLSTSRIADDRLVSGAGMVLALVLFAANALVNRL